MANNQEADTKLQGNSSSSESVAEKKSFFSIFKNAPKHHITFDENQTNKFLRITGLVLLALLSVFVLVKTINEIKTYSTIGESSAGMPYMISINGKGEVSAPKDVAILNFTSNAKGKTAADAQSKAAESNNKALEFIRSKGVKDADITTQNYNTYPIYDQKVKPCVIEGASPVSASIAPAGPVARPAPTTMYAPIAPCSTYESVITGFETSQTIEFKIRGIDKDAALAGDIVTGLAAAGVQVGNLQYKIDKYDELKAEARAIAIENARIQAKQIARSLGIRLGKVVSFNENDIVYPAMMSERAYGMAASDKAVSPELPGGEGKITSDVSVTFEIR